ncbi:ABC transporter substrate-binding protein [Burkholderia contaminans]|uniref:ABC transporter substrate-binding protein n=1 Tax=Burkholderia contaminans TaxID=488447 RepID=A0A3N8PV47_9BURK|nr:ABC transporter substrate-binding protein [Burkholderia contaminans]RQT14950.1 ABC transporter substrate-binding protein [Burkholderia contaminans]
MNRRDFLENGLKAGAALSLAGTPLFGRTQSAPTISFVSWGGSWGDFVQKYWIAPFTKQTGIGVTLVSGPDLAKVKAQVASNNILWDIVDGFTQVGAKENLWEPIDFKVIDPARFIVKPPSSGIPTNGYFGGIAYDPNRSKPPARDFAQFWNVKNIPGRRGLSNRVSEMLEMALLADGVSAAKLYPLDVDRAFKVLDRIKPSVKVWFSETGQGVSLIQSKEVEYTYTYYNRVTVAKDSGVSIDFSLDQCIQQLSYYSVVRGTPRKEAAMRFLEFITRPEQQAAVVNVHRGSLFSPVRGLDKLIEPVVKRAMPDLSGPKQVIFDNQYWADHFTELDKRFKEWALD